jgi:hypothetical protein
MSGEETDVKQKSLYARLKQLFSSGQIVRNVGGKKIKVKDTSDLKYATDRNSLRDRYNRVRSNSYNAYSRDFSLSYQAARIDLFRDYDCVGPDTIIPLPDGSRPTISELAEKYKDKPQERFWVYSYDHETDSIKLGKAFHPRKKKGKRVGYKVTFDNGQHVVGSLKHPFIMRDGSYKMIYELRVGDSVMPFYQRDYNSRYNKYKKLYNFSKGWQSEHVIVAEQFDRPLTENEVVHHKNFNGYDNSPNNLQIMTKEEHIQFHSNHSKNVLWGDENYENQLNKLKSHPNYINREFHHWDGDRHGENNPFYGKSHSDESNEKRSETLKEVFQNRDQSGKKNPKYRDDITFDNVKEKAFEFYKENSKINLWDFIEHIHCDHSTLQNRLKKEGHNWASFKNDVVSTLNHKIVSIEPIGEVDVYDVTVEQFANFATDSVFVKNTMDMDPIIASALDIYADECLTANEMGKMIVVHSEDDNIKEILNNLYYDILNVEHYLWSWVRNMCKYGDFFVRLYISPEYGIYMIEPISAYNVERIENSDPLNKNYVKFQIRPTDTSQVETLEFFECVHFRLLSDSNFLPYGKSMIEGGRRVWKQLSLLEDAMLINRIMRAPERRIFKVDVGNIPPQEVDAFMQKMQDKVKKAPYIDPQTGDYNLRFNLMNMIDDYWLPVRGSDSGTSIDTLSGIEWTGIDDIEYIRNKMMAALKIPKAFLGYEEELSGKATLASEDVRFARTIQRIQRVIISGLEQIAIAHLYAQGYRDESLVKFKIELTNPSTIFEKEKVTLWGEKVDVAKNMMENKLFSKAWIYKNVFNLSPDDADELLTQIVEDSKQLWRFKSIEEEGNDPAKPFQKINSGGNRGAGGPGGPGGPMGGMSEPGGIGASSPEEELAAALGEPSGGPGALQEIIDESIKKNAKWRQMEGVVDVWRYEDECPKCGEGMLRYKGSDRTVLVCATPGCKFEVKNGEPKSIDEGHGEHSEEWKKNRDQSGEHKSTNEPFGADPLGKLRSVSDKERKSPLTGRFKNNSPLSLETIKRDKMIISLNSYLEKNIKKEKKDLINESDFERTKSIMDEENILEE